ncbi:hypothetical protein GQ53DRAFT_752891 [Thozetella sp. PMI_491]|nr:hypothetical protein GQ53DRAFT_752891 [Thozetella sp. PMI_491]
MSRPPSFSSSEAAASLISGIQDAKDSVTTVRLPRGHVRSSSPARSSSTPTSWSSTDPAHGRSPDSRQLHPAAQLLQGVGVIELLEQDDRPTFIIDLSHSDNMKPGPLQLLYSNAALRASGSLHELLFVDGSDPDRSTEYSRFKAWILSFVNKDSNKESLDMCLGSLSYGGISWTCSTIRKRFRVVSGNVSAVSMTPTSPGRLTRASSVLDERARGPTPGKHGTTPIGESTVQDDYFGDVEAVTPAGRGLRSQSEPRSRLAEPVLEPSTRSQDDSALEAGVLEETRPSFDWTRIPIDMPNLSEHFKFARSVDWASTSLGPIEDWPADLRSMSNLIMGSPHPAAMYWGHDYVAIYNEAYISLAGQKHPRLMGMPYREAWAEIWDDIKPVFDSARHAGQATMKHDDCLFMTRNGFLEETFFDWSIVPLIGSDGSVVAIYNPAFENTRRKVTERRMLTLRDIGEKTSQAVDVKEFWAQVKSGLEHNERDVPFALIYSVSDGAESEAASMHSGSMASPLQLMLEGSLGVPEGHPVAATSLDLRTSTEGFAPYMRAAMADPDTPIILSKEAGTFPSSLVDGLAWRGFGDPCRTVVVFPVHPTTGRDTVVGFLVLGANPRRPYDGDYRLFIGLLSRQLATSMASVVLFEEEIRRGRLAARLAIQDKMELRDMLQKQTEQAILSEYRFSRMAEFGPVGMFITDDQGQINYCNDMWWKMSALAEESKYLGTLNLAVWMQGVRDEDRAGVEVVWRKLVLDKVAITHEFRFKGSCQVIDGQPVDTWVLLSAYPEKNENGELKSIFGCITDISEQKWAQDLQKRRRQEAVELKRQQENFIDMTSHEMRNPLSAILQCADEITSTIERNQLGDAVQTVPGLQMLLDSCVEAANTISLCANHQKRIVDDILTLSKLDSKLLLVTPIDVQPVTVVQDVLRMFEAELNSQGIQCRFQIEPSYLDLAVDWVKLDPSRIRQVLINLMTNAMKFTQSQEARCITIGLGASRDVRDLGFSYFPTAKKDSTDPTDEADWGDGEKINLHLAITDTGPGLDDDEKQILFRRFSQASPRTHVQYGGSGLGLFISRHLTELQGGQIGVASEKGVGSTFAFYIKCRRALVPQVDASAPFVSASDEAQGQTPSLAAPSDASTTPSSTLPSPVTRPLPAIPDPYAARPPFDVLIVEDNIVNQKVLERQLLICGSKTHVANHGAEALESLRQSRDWDGFVGENLPNFAIILMDIEMPIMDGITCTKRIRQLEEDGTIGRRIPILAVTAYARDEQIETAIAAGMDGVVSKPFRLQNLWPEIVKTLAKNGVVL